MKKRSIKHITLIRLVQVFLLAIVSIVFFMFLAYQEFFKSTVENKALEISTVVKAGLTSHMKAGIMDKRDYFLNEIKNINQINSIYIIRGKSVISQFGESKLISEKSHKDIDDLESITEASFKWNTKSGVVKAIIPYRASRDGKLNCLGCHNAKDKEILGALEIEMDIKSYQQLTLRYGYVFIGLLVFFAFFIILNIFNFIDKYITKPLFKIVTEGELAYKNNSSINVDAYDARELQSLAINLNDFNHEVLSKEEEIESTLRELMMAMGRVEEIRSKDTKNHTQRVAILSGLIAKEYGLSQSEIDLLILTAPLHDIGKIGISDEILLKPSRLNTQEYEVMKTHAALGYNVLRHSERLVLKTAADIAYSHHEKVDGTGYPQGIKGDEISIFAKIVAIVDVLDALLCKRVYKEAWSENDVKNHIEAERGKHFDPKLVDIVIRNFDEYSSLVEKMSGETKD